MLHLILRSFRWLFLKASAMDQTDELLYQLYTVYSTIFSTTQKNLPVLQHSYGTPARRRAQLLCPRAYYEDRLYMENSKYHARNTDKILKSKSLTTSTPTWLNTQDKKYLTTWMKAENVQDHMFYCRSSTVLDSSFMLKCKDTVFEVFKYLRGTLESLLRLNMASQCCFPYFQCSGSHCAHLIDVLLLPNPVLQNISSHAVMSQNFCFIKISCRFMEFNCEISTLQDWLFHLQFTKTHRHTFP